jgi:hypothetical protein
MPTSQRVEFESLDVSAYLIVAGYEVHISRNAEGKRAVFSFLEDAGLTAAIMAYERGGALPAKRLLNARSYLFREASRIVKGGA